MNAPDKFDPEKFAKLLALTREPFPASKKVYTAGNQYPDLRVSMREVTLTNGEAIPLYDTSGPYSDPQAVIDVRQGLAPMRASWIEARGDTEGYAGRPQQARDDGTKHEARESDRLASLRREASALQRSPRRARAGANVTQMHYALITPDAIAAAIP